VQVPAVPSQTSHLISAGLPRVPPLITFILESMTDYLLSRSPWAFSILCSRYL